jgi:hypothetical protein
MRYRRSELNRPIEMDGTDSRGASHPSRNTERVLTIEVVNHEFPLKTYEEWNSEQLESIGVSEGSSTLKPCQAPEGRDQCTICLESIEGIEIIRALKCSHCFHQGCIDRWLTSQRAECPLCKHEYYQPANVKQ